MKLGSTRRIALISFALLATTFSARADRVPSMTLEDQFGKSHRLSAPYSRPLIIAVANNRGSSKIEPWIAELYRKYGSTTTIVGLADLKGAPGFMHKPLKKLFLKHCPEHPVLLDWEGSAAAGFKRSSAGIDIFVSDRKGRIVTSASGAMTAQKMRSLNEVLSTETGQLASR